MPLEQHNSPQEEIETLRKQIVLLKTRIQEHEEYARRSFAFNTKAKEKIETQTAKIENLERENTDLKAQNQLLLSENERLRSLLQSEDTTRLTEQLVQKEIVSLTAPSVGEKPVPETLSPRTESLEQRCQRTVEKIKSEFGLKPEEFPPSQFRPFFLSNIVSPMPGQERGVLDKGFIPYSERVIPHLAVELLAKLYASVWIPPMDNRFLEQSFRNDFDVIYSPEAIMTEKGGIVLKKDLSEREKEKIKDYVLKYGVSYEEKIILEPSLEFKGGNRISTTGKVYVLTDEDIAAIKQDRWFS